MNKFKLAAALIGILIFGESACLIFFAQRSQKLSEKLAGLERGYEKIENKNREFNEKYEALFKENAAIKEDRNNLLAQAKGLLIEQGRLNEVEEVSERLKGDKESLEKEKEELSNQVVSLKGDVKKLKDAQKETVKERDNLKIAYEKEKKDTVRKKLQKELSESQKQKKDFEVKLKETQKENEQLKKQKSGLDEDKQELTEELKGLRKNYAAAVKKNKDFEQEIKDMPGKFTELAHQNKALIKETAQMHYNLGVFYTKNKEYRRAISEFEKVVEINPQDAYAHFNLGYIYSEYLLDRKKAVDQFRYYLTFAKKDDKDLDWAKKYLLTWETYEGKEPMK